MPRRNALWPRIVDAVGALERVVTHEELRQLGMPPGSISRKIGPHGPWQRLLPGVVLAHRGTPTRREEILAAIAFGGPGCVVSGADALRALGVRGVNEPTNVLVLVRHGRHRRSFGFTTVERTRRLPPSVVRQGIPYAPTARAVVDLCRHHPSVTDVRALVASVVQQGRCTVTELGTELVGAPRQRTASARLALAEVSDGVRSIAEARARRVLERSGLPKPQWNARLTRPDGTTYLTPDAWWPDLGAALEIDSRRWHLSPEDWARTQRRQRRLTAHGVMVMSFAPSEIIDDPDGFVREVRELLAAARQR